MTEQNVETGLSFVKRTCIWTYIFAYTSMYVYISICMYTCVFAHANLYTQVYFHVYIYICTWMFAYTHLYTHPCVFTCMFFMHMCSFASAKELRKERKCQTPRTGWYLPSQDEAWQLTELRGSTPNSSDIRCAVFKVPKTRYYLEKKFRQLK